MGLMRRLKEKEKDDDETEDSKCFPELNEECREKWNIQEMSLDIKFELPLRLPSRHVKLSG